MKEHKWHSIAYEPSYHMDDDPARWQWCSHCGSMRLGCDVFYIGGNKMTSTTELGCPDVYIAFQGLDYVVTDNIKEIEKQLLAKLKEPRTDTQPIFSIDPYELPPDEIK